MNTVFKILFIVHHDEDTLDLLFKFTDPWMAVDSGMKAMPDQEQISNLILDLVSET